jgi:hypothetical protein
VGEVVVDIVVEDDLEVEVGLLLEAAVVGNRVL